MGRKRIKLDSELIRRLRRAEPKSGLRIIAGRYYTETGQEVSFMTLWRFIKAELVTQEGNDGH